MPSPSGHWYTRDMCSGGSGARPTGMDGEFNCIETATNPLQARSPRLPDRQLLSSDAGRGAWKACRGVQSGCFRPESSLCMLSKGSQYTLTFSTSPLPMAHPSGGMTASASTSEDQAGTCRSQNCCVERSNGPVRLEPIFQPERLMFPFTITTSTGGQGRTYTLCTA